MTDTRAQAREILAFWFAPDASAEFGKPRRQWFSKDPAFDAEVRRRFEAVYDEVTAPTDRASSGAGADAWLGGPAEALAAILLLDQFPRNMYRDTARAFASDAAALAIARSAVARAYDAGLIPVQRLFVYLPFEHSEHIDDQRRSLALIAPLAAYPEVADSVPYAQRHFDVIARFGRFPHRNRLLGRSSTPEEEAFLREPGSRF